MFCHQNLTFTNNILALFSVFWYIYYYGSDRAKQHGYEWVSFFSVPLHKPDNTVFSHIISKHYYSWRRLAMQQKDVSELIASFLKLREEFQVCRRLWHNISMQEKDCPVKEILGGKNEHRILRILFKKTSSGYILTGCYDQFRAAMELSLTECLCSLISNEG